MVAEADEQEPRTVTIKIAEDVGVVISMLRDEAGLSQEQLADRLGVTRRYGNELERGKDTKAIVYLIRVLRGLGAEIEVILPGAVR